MIDKRPLIVFAVFLLGIAAIVVFTRLNAHSSHGAICCDADNTGSTSTTISQVTTTTTSVTGTNTPTTVTNTSADQWKQIFDYMVGVQNAMFQDPDPNKVDLIMDPSCTCYTDTRLGVQALADKKWHVQGDTLRTTTVALVNKTDTQIRLAVTYVGTGSPTVDQNGKVQEKGSTGLREPILYVLNKSANGTWLIADRHGYEEQ